MEDLSELIEIIKDVLEDIIIAIQDDKLAIQESVDSIVIPKLNEINGKVEAINTNTEP